MTSVNQSLPLVVLAAIAVVLLMRVQARAARKRLWRDLAHKLNLNYLESELPATLLDSGLISENWKIRHGAAGMRHGELVVGFEYSYRYPFRPFRNEYCTIAVKQLHPGRDGRESSIWNPVERSGEWALFRSRLGIVPPDGAAVVQLWDSLRTTSDAEAEAYAEPAPQVHGGIVIRPRHEMRRQAD